MRVEGRAAVVTGAATGIGFGIAQALVAKGCEVMLADIEKAKVEEAAEALRAAGGTVEVAECDVRSHSSITELADRAWATFKDVQLVFNNAGVGATADVIDLDPAEVDWIMDVNFKGVWNGYSVFGKRFRDQGKRAAICTTASEHSLGVPHLGQGIYTASKHAVLGMSDVMRRELPNHISVSLICPGLVQTELHNAARNGPKSAAADAAAQAVGEQVMARGMDPLYIGMCAVEGVERGDFLIVTHPHARAYAEKRWQEIDDAFKNAPHIENSQQYDMTSVIRDVLSTN